MERTANELYAALDEIMRSVRNVKTYSGTTLTVAEKCVVDNNFTFIEQRGTEALRAYERTKQELESERQ